MGLWYTDKVFTEVNRHKITIKHEIARPGSMKGTLFIVSAPSGAGKSSLVKSVLENMQLQWPIERGLTYTTRQPRSGEQNGRSFHFIENHEFERHVQDDFFLEWSNAYLAYYGTPCSIVKELEKGLSFVLVIDRVGAQKVLDRVTDAVLIWIEAPSISALRERLTQRKTDSLQQVERRLQRACIEIDLEQKKPLYRYHLINDNFELAAEQLTAILVQELQWRAIKK